MVLFGSSWDSRMVLSCRWDLAYCTSTGARSLTIKDVLFLLRINNPRPCRWPWSVHRICFRSLAGQDITELVRWLGYDHSTPFDRQAEITFESGISKMYRLNKKEIWKIWRYYKYVAPLCSNPVRPVFVLLYICIAIYLKIHCYSLSYVVYTGLIFFIVKKNCKTDTILWNWVTKYLVNYTTDETDTWTKLL